MNSLFMIAVVIPSYKVKKHILHVISRIGQEVSAIYVVDDQCPEQTGTFVLEKCHDPRVKVLFHEVNQGVGGAMITGYKQALKDGHEVIVKIDGDGQMDPALLPMFVQPILDGKADYTKGNRFFHLSGVKNMPAMRLFGNALLSFVNKVVNGYWDIVDPNNGYTAIHTNVLKFLPLDKIETRYFFESDMLFRLNTVRAVVWDIPMDAMYGDEESNLRITRVLLEFPPKYFSRFIKRIFYNYFLRDFNVGSLELVCGTCLTLFGGLFGMKNALKYASLGIEAPSGTVMAAALPVILGFQLLLSALSYDISNIPRHPLSSYTKAAQKSLGFSSMPIEPQK